MLCKSDNTGPMKKEEGEEKVEQLKFEVICRGSGLKIDESKWLVNFLLEWVLPLRWGLEWMEDEGGSPYESNQKS